MTTILTPAHNVLDVQANGFGLWSATITLAEPRPRAEINFASLRGTARRAIKRELVSRGEAEPEWRCRVVQRGMQLDGGNVVSVTFQEAGA